MRQLITAGKQAEEVLEAIKPYIAVLKQEEYDHLCKTQTQNEMLQSKYLLMAYSKIQERLSGDITSGKMAAKQFSALIA